MGERPTIAFRLDETQKREWEQYVEENEEYESVSHLIRLAVTHEMSDLYGPLGRNSRGESGANTEQIGELITTVQKMQNRLQDVEEAVDDATEAAYTGNKVPQDVPSEGELLSVLPQREENAMQTQAVAAEVGVTDPITVHWIGMELHRMEQETGAVKSVVQGGHDSFGEAMASGGKGTTTLWYREG